MGEVRGAESARGNYQSGRKDGGAVKARRIMPFHRVASLLARGITFGSKNWSIPGRAVNIKILSILCLLAPLSCLRAAPVEIIPPELHGAVQPQIAVSPNGHVHVTFGKDNAVYYTGSVDGRTFSAPVKVAELDKLALRKRRGPRIAATNEVVLVTAISHADGNLHSWTSTNEGRTWKESAPLNTVPTSAREGLHATVGDGKGLVGAVWLDDRNQTKELWGRFSHDGGRTWDAGASIYKSPDGHICECCHPSLAIAPNGEISAMWRNWLGGSRDLYRIVSHDGGATFAGAEKLGSGTWKFNACPMDGGSFAYSPDARWLAVWRREGTVFASTKDAPEESLAKESSQPVAAFAGSAPIVLWESQRKLMLRRGTDAPVSFAAGLDASIASGPDAVSVVWEAGEGKSATLMFDRVK